MKTCTFILPDESWRYPSFELLQAFDPSCEVVYEANDGDLSDSIEVSCNSGMLCFHHCHQGSPVRKHAFEVNRDSIDKETYKRFLYLFMCEIFGHTLPWGTLTGIKPVKIAHAYMVDEGLTVSETEKQMRDQYAVSEQKASLATALAVREMPIVHPDGNGREDKSVSVYVGIPICPAKCRYCSFVSTVADAKGLLTESYLTNLIAEIEAMKTLITDKNLRIDTLYIGGGTPSVFKANQLERLLTALDGVFIHPDLREFTFEAGRPETTTPEKLRLLKDFGVDRICLNPQSMNADTLRAVNRHHTPEDICERYQEIRQIGFKSVNMDLIVGLNQESPEAFLHSLDAVIALRPENLTVHSLAIKHGSAIREAEGHVVTQLYDDAFYESIAQRLSHANYHPYYLYRQKYTQGSGENIGYCLPGYEGIYNILMMAERQTIIGIGAGSSGKVYDREQNRFSKVFTVKDIRTYNTRPEEIIQRKLSAYNTI